MEKYLFPDKKYLNNFDNHQEREGQSYDDQEQGEQCQQVGT